MQVKMKTIADRTGAFLKRFRQDRSGVVSAETAIALTVLTSLLLSGVEVTRYVVLSQKIERASTTIADLVAREETINESKLNDTFAITEQILKPFPMDATTEVIVSSIVRSATGVEKVKWQRNFGGGHTSAFGTEGNAPTMPPDLILRDGESMIVTEVFRRFEPVFVPDTVAAANLYSWSVFRPRFSALNSIASN